MQQIRKVKSDEIITLVLTTASSPLYNLTACSRGRPHTPAGHFLPTPVTHLTLSTLLAAMSLDALAQKPARQLGPYRTGRLALALAAASRPLRSFIRPQTAHEVWERVLVAEDEDNYNE